MRDISELIGGFKEFRATYFEQHPQVFENLTREGQRPEVLVIACSDSRVDPAILFNTGPGELFVVRNVANLVPPYQPDGHYHGTSAALEFAVRDLGVRDIVILGHSQCGGIEALCEAAQGRGAEREFITPWMSLASASAAGEGADNPEGHDHSHLEQAAIAQSIDNLRSFPWIAAREEAGDIALHGWWFDLEKGDLWALDHESRNFSPMEL